MSNKTEIAFRVNLTNLKRIDSAVVDIVDRASHVVVYAYDARAKSWNKRNIEGTLFVVKRAESPYFALVVLNRLEPENLVSYFGEGMKFEVKETFLTYRDDDGTYGLWFHETEDVQRVAALFALYCPPSPTAAATLVGSSLPGHHGASGAAGAALIDANVSESGFAANGNSDSHAGAHMVAPDSMPFTADDVLKRLIMSATQSQPTATASFTPQPQYVPPPSATPSQQIPTAATASASTAAAPIPTAHQDPSGFLFHMITGGARVTSDSANGIQPPTKAHLNATPSTMNAPVAQLQASPKPATSSSLMHASQVPLQVLRHRATSSQLQQKSVSGATQSPRSAPSSQQPSVAQQAPPSLSAAQQQPNVTQLAPPFQQSSVVPPFQQSSLKEIGMPQQMIQQQQQQPMPQRLPPPPQHIQTRSEFLSWYAHMLHTDPVFQDVLYDAYLKRQYQHQLPYHHQQ